MATDTDKTAIFPRLLAVDLTNLTEQEMTALRQECIRRRVPMHRLLGELVTDCANRLLNPDTKEQP